VAGKRNIMRLLWKSFIEDAIAPKFRKPMKKPEKGKETVNLTLFRNGWCQSMNITCERAKRAALEFPGKVNIQELDTTNSEVLKEWGITDSLFLDGKEVMTGPPINYEKIRKKIEKRIRKYS
jgi:hypothetical protein